MDFPRMYGKDAVSLTAYVDRDSATNRSPIADEFRPEDDLVMKYLEPQHALVLSEFVGLLSSAFTASTQAKRIIFNAFQSNLCHICEVSADCLYGFERFMALGRFWR